MVKPPPKTDEQLMRDAGSLKLGSPKRLLIEDELRRRREAGPTRRALILVAAGVITALATVAALFLR